MTATMTAQWSPPSWSSEDRLAGKLKATNISWLEAAVDGATWKPPVWEKRSGLKRTVSPQPVPAAFSFTLPAVRPKPAVMQRQSTVAREEDVWSQVVDEAVTEGNASLELSRRGLKTVSAAVRDLRLMTKLVPYDSSEAPAIAEVKLYLGTNMLTASSISNSLFMLHNLVVLSLRENLLEELPCGIGRLAGLKELNIGGNRLTCLPAELQNLELRVLNLTPNPWLPIPMSVPADAQSYLLPLITHHAVPTLIEFATRRLLQPCEPPSPPLGSSISGAFSRTSSTASVSGADSYGAGPCRVVHAYKGDVRDLPRHLATPFREVIAIPQSGSAGFDALGHLCAAGRSPVHADAPHAAVFTVPCQTRIQFTKHVAGVELSLLVPLQWRGCLPGCLAFLEPVKPESEVAEDKA